MKRERCCGSLLRCCSVRWRCSWWYPSPWGDPGGDQSAGERSTSAWRTRIGDGSTCGRTRRLGLRRGSGGEDRRAAGVSLKIVPLPWGDGDAGSVSGAWSPGGWPPFGVDLIPLRCDHHPRARRLRDLSEPYFTAGQMVLFRKAVPDPRRRALAGRKLGVQQATTSESVREGAFRIERHSFRSSPLVRGLLDAACDAGALRRRCLLSIASFATDGSEGRFFPGRGTGGLSPSEWSESASMTFPKEVEPGVQGPGGRG
jgi:hypothetical protein